MKKAEVIERRQRVKQYIAANPDTSQIDICAALNMVPSAVHRAVKWLENQKSVQRVANKFFVADGGPRVLVFDIETTPTKSWHWRCFKENIAPKQIIQHSHLLCYAAKWLDSEQVIFDSTKYDDSDERCCRTLWHLFEEADVLIAHNGRAFDTNYMQARWMYYDMVPPSPYKTIDTLKIAKANLRVPSRGLEGLLRYFELGGKLSHCGFQLWLDCMGGDEEGWKTMEDYNIQDVLMLQEFYLKVRPWAKMHPNLANMYADDKIRCVKCGCEELKDMGKKAYTVVSSFPACRCTNCGTVLRSGKRFDPKVVLRNVV